MAAAARPIPHVLMRPVLWALVLAALIGYAAYASFHIPVEVLPQFNFPQISVIAPLPAATASELESLVVDPLEGQILTLPDLQSVRSTMGNGTVEIDVRFREGTSAAAALQAVNGALDRARAVLPPATTPVAQIMGNSINEVADYAAEIPTDVAPAEVQRAVLANVAPALRALPGVQYVNVYGAGDEALWIQPDLGALRQYGVSISAIAQAVKDEVLLKPAGYTMQGHNDVLIEARHLPAHIAQLEAIPVRGPHGPVPLGALARVVREAIPTHNA